MAKRQTPFVLVNAQPVRRQLGRQQRASPMETRADRADCTADGLRRIHVTHLLEVAQHDDFAVAERQRQYRLAQPFDSFRAPLSAGDRERRVSAGLTPLQMELLDRWGYPYVLDQFQFHMTLAGPAPEEQRRKLRDLLWQAYRTRASSVVEIDAISVMRQDDHGARFRVLRRCRLKG